MADAVRGQEGGGQMIRVAGLATVGPEDKGV